LSKFAHFSQLKSESQERNALIVRSSAGLSFGVWGNNLVTVTTKPALYN